MQYVVMVIFYCLFIVLKFLGKFLVFIFIFKYQKDIINFIQIFIKCGVYMLFGRLSEGFSKEQQFIV